MEPEQAKKLGEYLREARQAKGLSKLALAAITNINDATIFRIEDGQFNRPSPDKLARIAEVLEVPLADVFALADYAVPTELPSFAPYLRTKYRDLPDEAREAIETYAEQIAHKHGVALAGPVDAQDESP